MTLLTHIYIFPSLCAADFIWHRQCSVRPCRSVLPRFFFTPPSRHTHTSRLGVSLRSELIRPKTGTALPNHIAASKSSVYISNYIVACGVLEHSGRSAFHLCAESRPLPLLPYFSPCSSFLQPYLFISDRLIFVVVSVDSALSGSAHLPADPLFFELSIAGQSRPSGAAGSSLMICLLSCSNLQGSTI